MGRNATCTRGTTPVTRAISSTARDCLDNGVRLVPDPEGSAFYFLHKDFDGSKCTNTYSYDASSGGEGGNIDGM